MPTTAPRQIHVAQFTRESVVLFGLSCLFLVTALAVRPALNRLVPSRQFVTWQSVGDDDSTPATPASVQEATSRPAPDSTSPPKPSVTVETKHLGVAELAPVYYRISTKQPVIFLGIDDGGVKDDRAIDYIKAHQYPFTLFLTNSIAGNNYAYFKRIVTEAGNTVENHTLTHPQLTKLSYDEQKREICGQQDIVQRVFGRRPTLFRPPYGDFNTDTRRAAAACGIKAIVHWSAKVNGGAIQYQVGSHFRSGDIILMHFRPEIMDDLAAFTKEVDVQGLTVGKLEDWLK